MRARAHLDHVVRNMRIAGESPLTAESVEVPKAWKPTV